MGSGSDNRQVGTACWNPGKLRTLAANAMHWPAEVW